MTNVRNEGRWLRRCLESMLRICNLVVVYSDDSTDDTVSIAESFHPRTIVIASSSRSLDKTRDKNIMLATLLHHIPRSEQNETNQHWVLAIDGDEELEPSTIPFLLDCVTANPTAYCIGLRVLYLWDTEDQVRVDGVYSRMIRPSLFRIINSAYRFLPTPFPGNLHCPNVPQELLWNRVDSSAVLRHYGYLHRSNRIAKWESNVAEHPDSEGEDYYRHCIIGDVPSLPPSTILKHAGPLTLEPISSHIPSK